MNQTENYVGSVLFVQFKADRRYMTDEYIILKQSGTALFGISTGLGHKVGELVTIPLDVTVDIVEARHDPMFLEQFLSNLESFVKERDLPHDQRRYGDWIASVYAGAETHVRWLRKIVLCQRGDAATLYLVKVIDEAGRVVFVTYRDADPGLEEGSALLQQYGGSKLDVAELAVVRLSAVIKPAGG